MTTTVKAAPCCKKCGAAVSPDPRLAPEGLCKACFDRMVEEYLAKYGPRCFTCEALKRTTSRGGTGRCRSKKLIEVKISGYCPGWYRAKYPEIWGAPAAGVYGAPTSSESRSPHILRAPASPPENSRKSRKRTPRTPSRSSRRTTVRRKRGA